MKSVALLMALLISPALALAATPDGRQIMEWADERDDGDRMTQKTEMTLIDKNGKKRMRQMHAYTRDVGEDTQQILFFESPADVKDTGFLTYDYDESDRDDDQWLYLPALRKIKRISSADKSGSFMGSDFTYADMTSRDLDAYDFKLLGEGEVRGAPVWKVEAIPRHEREVEETGYTKSVFFVRQDNYVMVRAVYWVKKGDRLKYHDVKKLEEIDGIWTPTEIHMTLKKGKTTQHKTVLRNSETRYNQELDESLFTTRRLEKGL